MNHYGILFSSAKGEKFMEREIERFLQQIDSQIAAKHLLKHPFYQAWSRGELSLSCLQEYAKDYYQHVKAFPTYISAVHAGTEEMATRRVLLKNLIEEEDGSPNHPELWKQFVLALGVTEEELANHNPSEEMAQLIAQFRKICREGSSAEGIAALYAYESQIPEICHSKIEGLKTHYGMAHPKDWQYFSVHIAADQEHAAQERALLKKHLNSQNQEPIAQAVDQVLDKLWNFLTGLCHRYRISATC